MHHVPRLFALALTAVAIFGCTGVGRTDTLGPDHHGRANETMIRAAFDASVRQAVVTERTVYPYHFVDQAAELNMLGLSHVQRLATALRATPGTVNLPRGDVSVALYEQRVESLREALRHFDVDADAVEVIDDFPGGRGMPAARVRSGIEAQRDERYRQRGTN